MRKLIEKLVLLHPAVNFQQLPPPLSFEALWYSMGVRKRTIVFENVIQKTDLSAERLNARLCEIHHGPTSRLAHKLTNCSMAVFGNYIRVLSGGKATTIGDFTLSSVASSTNTTTTIEMEGKAAPLQAPKPVKKAHIFEPDIPHRECKSDVSASLPTSDESVKPADLPIRQHVHNLPPELFDKMLQDFLHTALGPRKIYVGIEYINMRVFGALNAAMYAKQRSTFLSESVWVIGQGNYQETTSFLNKMPVSMLKCIKRIELRLTRQDYKHPSLDYYFDLPYGTTPSIDRLDCLLNYMRECEKFKYELVSTWLGKIHAVMALKHRLDELVLDVSDAYGPDDDFFGRDFAIATNGFAGDTPVNVVVLGIDNH